MGRKENSKYHIRIVDSVHAEMNLQIDVKWALGVGERDQLTLYHQIEFACPWTSIICTAIS